VALRKVLKRTKRGIQYVEHTEGDGLTVTASTGRHWPKVQLQESARQVRNEEQAVSLSRLL
jgi:hypothetical protein